VSGGLGKVAEVYAAVGTDYALRYSGEFERDIGEDMA
jgi:hypothetical protein